MADYYVRTDGSNSNSGTGNSSSLAWATIDYASSHVSPGDTVNVASGVYAGGFTTTGNGNSSNQITFKSITKWGAKIAGSGSSYIWSNTGNYVTVDGFELYGAGNQHGLISGPWSGGDVGHHFIALNNYIHDMAVNFNGSGGALTVYSATGRSQIIGNIILNVDVANIGVWSSMQGIYLSEAGGNYTANNIVGGISTGGIQQWHGASNSVIVNNTVFYCWIGILIGQGSGDGTPQGTNNNYVANNIVANMVAGNGVGIRGTDGVDAGNNQYLNNILYNCPTTISVNGDDIVSGNITSDPKFINYQQNGTGDYHLQSTSPAIDAGLASGVQLPSNTPVNFPTTDLDQNSRPQGAQLDIGAYEYLSGASGGDGIAGSSKNWRRKHFRGFR